MLSESVISDAANISKWCCLLYNLYVYLFQFYLFRLIWVPIAIAQ